MSPATQQSVRQTNRIFEQEVIAQGNIDALDRVYTADARILPPGAEMVSGRENIKAFWRGAIEGMNLSGGRLESVEFVQQGDTGYEIGRGTLEFASGAPAITAKYVVVWKVEDGAWKWHVDIWNMSA
jgi:ketosteroid isomerase-like protein